MAEKKANTQTPNPVKRRAFRSVSMNWLLPNMLTIGGLVSGLTALRYALDGKWMAAVTLIVLAAIFDALDGRMARLLKSTSAFGAALDSLSDAVVFGVVPALCLYLWALQGSGNFAWGTALFFAVCICCAWPDSIQNCQTGRNIHKAFLSVFLPLLRLFWC